MMIDPSSAARAFGRSPAMKLLVMVVLTIMMSIPLTFISGTLGARQESAAEAAADIAGGWGGSQNIAGIFLTVPFEMERRVEGADGGETYVERHITILLPTFSEITANARTEERSRGIFETTVYDSELLMHAEFDVPSDASVAPSGARIRWSEATAVIGVSDVRGIGENPTLRLADRTIGFAPGSGANAIGRSSIHAPLSLDGRSGRLVMDTVLNIRGTSELSFVPLGRETLIRVRSSWPHPSFFGAFLPTQRQVGPDGFDAIWRVPYLARGFDQVLGPGDLLKVDEAAFGTRFHRPVDFYQLVSRSLKYAVLFVGMSFLVFFVTELVIGAGLHAVQYFFIGSAQVLFYLLLLSFSEHLGFDIAYAIAASATVLLSVVYGTFALSLRRRGIGLLGSLSALYGALYFLLQVEGYALLMGSVLLFAALALTMYLTRNVDWSRKNPVPVPAVG